MLFRIPIIMICLTVSIGSFAFDRKGNGRPTQSKDAGVQLAFHSHLSKSNDDASFKNVRRHVQSDRAKNKTLRVGYSNQAPYVYRNIGNEVEKPQGLNFWIWEGATRKLDIESEYVLLRSADLREALLKGQVDVVLNPATTSLLHVENQELEEEFFLSTPILSTYSSFVSYRGNAQSKISGLLSSLVSLRFLEAMFALIATIMFFGAGVWFFERRGNNEEFENSIQGLWQGFWWSAVTMTTVGYGDKSPRTLGGRLIALVWMFSAIVLISGFTASIASSLTVNGVSARQSLEDFRDARVGVVKNEGSQDWLERQLFRKVVEYDDLESASNALQKDDIDVLAYDEPSLQFLIEEKKLVEGIELVPGIRFGEDFLTLIYSKHVNAKDRRALDSAIAQLRQSLEWSVLMNDYGI